MSEIPIHPLASARHAAKLTQKELAARSGVGLRSIGNYEAGRFLPLRSQVRALAVVLEIDPDMLLAAIRAWQTAHKPPDAARA